MKKLLLTLLVVMSSASVFAMSSYRARQEAWFLTDKMAYELYLTEDQMEDVFEINYDYFRSLVNYRLPYTLEYNRRLEDLSFVLSAWQWRKFRAIEDFVTPVKVINTSWSFVIYNRYVRGLNYYNKPRVYSIYVGGHKNNPGYYKGRQPMHLEKVRGRVGNPNTDRKHTIPSYVNKRNNKVPSVQSKPRNIPSVQPKPNTPSVQPRQNQPKQDSNKRPERRTRTSRSSSSRTR